MYTESQAVLKQCPENASISSTVHLSNSNGGQYSGNFNSVTMPLSCVASRCMAWRWADDQEKTGYCGKAGKPY